MITEEQFKLATGRAPEQDDLERSNCPDAGQPRHHQCGWCEEHNKPRFVCGCLIGLSAKQTLEKVS